MEAILGDELGLNASTEESSTHKGMNEKEKVEVLTNHIS
jgi:hypothetical protein